MLCDICHQRPANVHVTKIVNNTRTELHLCQQCAKERGELEVFESPKFAISNILAGLLQSEPQHAKVFGAPSGGRLTCSTCGLDYSEFMNTGFLGCSDCYSQFAPMLNPLILRIHGHTRHTGKVPRRAGKAVRVRHELEALRKELKQLIEAEEYEKAALVRDKIRELEKASCSGETCSGKDGGESGDVCGSSESSESSESEEAAKDNAPEERNDDGGEM